MNQHGRKEREKIHNSEGVWMRTGIDVFCADGSREKVPAPAGRTTVESVNATFQKGVALNEQTPIPRWATL